MSRQEIEQDIRRIEAQILQIESRIAGKADVSPKIIEHWETELENLREALRWKKECL